MATNLVALMRSKKGRRLMRGKCAASGLDIDVLERLIEVELSQVGKKQKHGITAAFDDIFCETDKEEE